jgi:peroxiredoxin
LCASSGCQGGKVTHYGDSGLAASREAATLSLATLGQEAPNFTLPTLDGAPVRLSDYRGKYVVLEWFNPLCPFTRHAHTQGTLATYPTQAREQDVIWLAVNSAPEEKMGGSPEDSRAASKAWSIDYPLMLDPTGRVGRQFDATTTPEVFLIDPAGVLVYVGAIDNMPFGKVRGGGEGVNYLAQALEESRAGGEVTRPARQPYGCRVKYAQPTLGN